MHASGNVAEPRRKVSTEQSAGVQFYKQAFGGAWMTQAIGVAAELGIADLLAEAPQTPEQLAKQTNTHALSLYRLLRALASVGIFAEDKNCRFALTELAELLRSDVPNSQRAFARLMGGELHEAWAELQYAVTTGNPGFDKRHHLPLFQYLCANPERHGVFDAGMTAIHDPETQPVIDAFDWTGYKHVVDVGGGNGLSLLALIDQQTHLRGTVFEMPAVAERALENIAAQQMDNRCNVVEGDFFDEVPADADIYTLRHILHDWDDEAAVSILQNCRDAMVDNGRVLIIESVIPERNAPHFGKWLDLMMLLIGGRERTAQEYEALLNRAGLKLQRIIPTTSDVSIVEAFRN
jgi:SAM-dependent methyltransferase